MIHAGSVWAQVTHGYERLTALTYSVPVIGEHLMTMNNASQVHVGCLSLGSPEADPETGVYSGNDPGKELHER